MPDWYKIKKIYVWQDLARPLVPATAISLNQAYISLTSAWQTSQLVATLTPADSTSKVTWTSSNTSIATVSSTWLVTCVTPWNATITATTNNWLTATCSVRSSIVYDFTTQNVLTFVVRQNSYTWYGWSSWNWYYSTVQNSSYYRTNTVWSLPNDAFGGTLDKIIMEFNIPNLYSWWWVVFSNTSSANSNWIWLWYWDSNTQNWLTFPWPTNYSYSYSTGIQVLTIDFANKLIGTGTNLGNYWMNDSRISTARTAWNNKTLYLNVVANQAYVTTYLRKVEIFTS